MLIFILEIILVAYMSLPQLRITGLLKKYLSRHELSDYAGFNTFWGLARPPTSYGAYAGDNKDAAKYASACLLPLGCLTIML